MNVFRSCNLCIKDAYKQCLCLGEFFCENHLESHLKIDKTHVNVSLGFLALIVELNFRVQKLKLCHHLIMNHSRNPIKAVDKNAEQNLCK
jgi:hypothetical protein